MGLALFKSVCPGVARTIRAESMKVTVVSLPPSVVRTAELPLMDLTVPTALAAGFCAEAAMLSKNTTGSISAVEMICKACCQAGFASFEGMDTLVNSIMGFEASDVKNCQTEVKVGWCQSTGKVPANWLQCLVLRVVTSVFIF